MSTLYLQMIVLGQNVCNKQCPGRSIDLPWTMQKTFAAFIQMLSQQRAIANIFGLIYWNRWWRFVVQLGEQKQSLLY